MKKEQMIVTAAIIEKDGRYLITQRSAGGHLALKWEFPGGGVKFGERPEFCLMREIKEELRIGIMVGELLGLSSYVYGGTRHVILLGYLCEFISGRIKKGINYAWVTPKEMDKYDFCEADAPFVKKLQGKRRRKMEKGIPINVLGRQATIDRLLPAQSIAGQEKFVVVVELGEENPWGLISIAPWIPAKDYSREELIRVVTQVAEEGVKNHIKARIQQKTKEDHYQQVKSLAKEVSRRVGL